jgi:hypothetical protein
MSPYLGIVPKSRESNQKVRYGKTTKKGRKTARAFMSQMVFHFINSNVLYTEFYEERKKAKGSAKAIVAMVRKLAVIIYHMLKKRQNYYHINEELHKRRLHEWLRILNQMRSLTGDQLNRWENEIRIKYYLVYRSRKTAELKKPAWLYHRGGVGRKATSSQIPHGCGAFFKQEGGRRGEDPPEDSGLHGDPFAEKENVPAGHHIQKRLVASSIFFENQYQDLPHIV